LTNTECKSKLKKLLEDAKTLYDTAVTADNEVTETEEFMLLKRMLGEQTDYDDDDFNDLEPDNIEAKDGKDLKSDILQNPSDPDATFRKKY
jgi:predicted nucleotidyltransferase component of viral defense system